MLKISLLILLTITIKAFAVPDKNSKDIAMSFEAKMTRPQFKVENTDSNLRKKYEASTLVISCVDFRFQDSYHQLLKDLGIFNDYDNLALPGASLAVMSKKYPAWNQAINEVIPLLKTLHKIKRVILLDHRDCRAYKLIVGKNYTKTKETEFESHKEIMLAAKQLIEEQYPDIKVYGLLIGLDGVVENLL